MFENPVMVNVTRSKPKSKVEGVYIVFKLVGSAKPEVDVVELVDHKTLEESGANPTNEIVSPSQIEVGAVKLTVCSGLKFNVIVSDTSNAVPHCASARAVTFKMTTPSLS